MLTAPSILVAGNETLYLDLSERLPKTCRVFYCETIGETLDRAVDASIVLVDQGIAGGGNELCTRLRTDPMTAGIPLILHSTQAEQDHVADQVLPPDVDATIDALRAYFPNMRVSVISAAVEAEPQRDAYFDLDESTVSWRPGDVTDDWPPPPPRVEENVDTLDLTRDLAGYVNSLVEAHEHPDSLTDTQRARLAEMSAAVLQSMDSVLGVAQQAVNESLRAKDLGRMRELSAAKTALFERLQRLRSINRATGTDQPQGRSPRGAAPDGHAATGTTGPRPRPQMSRATPAVDGGNVAQRPAALGTTGPHPPGAATAGVSRTGLQPVKSQLTRAAEQRDRARKTEARQQARGHHRAQQSGKPSAPSPAGSARRNATHEGSESAIPRMLLILSALLIVGISVYALLRTNKEQVPPERTTNAAPAMKYVTTQQTPAGVIARPHAEDREADRVVYSIRWFVDDAEVAGARTARLAPDHYREGMAIQVEVTPNDAFGKGDPMRSQKLQIVAMGSPSATGAQTRSSRAPARDQRRR